MSSRASPAPLTLGLSFFFRVFIFSISSLSSNFQDLILLFACSARLYGKVYLGEEESTMKYWCWSANKQQGNVVWCVVRPYPAEASGPIHLLGSSSSQRRRGGGQEDSLKRERGCDQRRGRCRRQPWMKPYEFLISYMQNVISQPWQPPFKNPSERSSVATKRIQ